MNVGIGLRFSGMKVPHGVLLDLILRGSSTRLILTLPFDTTLRRRGYSY